jgi:hypothetical protein
MLSEPLIKRNNHLSFRRKFMNLLKVSAVLAATSLLPLVLSTNANAQPANAAAGVAVVDLPDLADDDRSDGLGVAAAAAFAEESAIVAGQVAFYDDADFDIGFGSGGLDDSVVIEAYAFGTDDRSTYEVETINWSSTSDPGLFED